MSSLVEKSLPELTIDDGEFLIMRERLIQEKNALQGQLAEINAQCSHHLPQREYHKLQSWRGQIVRQLLDKDSEISELNARRAELNTVINVRKQESFSPHQVRQLVEMRDRWHGFSMDAKRHQKERETWWHCSQELRELLKHYFDGGKA